MTSPDVDIAAAVELVETRLGNRGDGFAYREMTRDEEWLLLKAFKAIADERATVEQRIADLEQQLADAEQAAHALADDLANGPMPGSFCRVCGSRDHHECGDA